jgi:hypothetical protein
VVKKALRPLRPLRETVFGICVHLWLEVLLSGTPNFSLHIPHF